MKHLIIGLVLAGLAALLVWAPSHADEYEDKVVEIYKTEFERYAPATCDGTNSTGYIYVGQLNGSEYSVRRNIMWNKVEFLMVTDSMAEEYFFIISEDGKVTETHHADWDAQLVDASPGFFGLIHNKPHDCKF